MSARHEYRVQWHRAAWKPRTATKSRAFDRRSDAIRFYERLASDGRPELSALTVLRLDAREVGEWKEARS